MTVKNYVALKDPKYADKKFLFLRGDNMANQYYVQEVDVNTNEPIGESFYTTREQIKHFSGT